MSKRANHEGSLCRRKDGRWQASLMVAGKRVTVYGRTRQEAADKLRQLQTLAQANGRLPDAGKLTLGDYLHTWLNQAEQRLRPKTLACYRGLVKRLIVPHLGNVRLTRLTGLTLATYMAHLNRDGVSLFQQRQLFLVVRPGEEWQEHLRRDAAAAAG
ncbi:MAG: hypothetical protein ACP5R2_05255 [Anaerolineae bacterium]